MTDLNKQEYSRHEAKDEAKKDRTKKLHSSIMNMLLMASADALDEAPAELAQTCVL